MSFLCQKARRQWLDRVAALETRDATDPLEGGGLGVEHLASCSACREWQHGVSLQLRAFRELPTLEAPEELERRLFPSARPSRELDASSPAIQAVRALDRLEAPAVLERLVAEELSDPAAARADRFAGGLDRINAPRLLERRLVATLRRGTRSRRWIAPLAVAAAAVTLLWMGVNRQRGIGGGGDEREYSFEVIRPASLDGMDPFARSLAETLGGHPRVKGGDAR